jgi:ketosteroid isomerase-like protein
MVESCPAEGVRRTLHAYCEHLDEQDLGALMDQVYLPDAVDDRQRGEPLRGHDAIRGYFERALRTLRATAHLLSNVDVAIEGATARASSRVTAYHWSRQSSASTGTADFVLLGTYRDRLRLTEDGWRIEHRLVGALGPSGLAVGALPAAFAGFGGQR